MRFWGRVGRSREQTNFKEGTKEVKGIDVIHDHFVKNATFLIISEIDGLLLFALPVEHNSVVQIMLFRDCQKRMN